MTKLFEEIASLSTEQNNPNTKNIDTLSSIEILECINNEDALVIPAVKNEIEHIAQAVELVVNAFRNGGRLFYVGAGTSGRLGVVDASECPPTFGVDPEMVQGIIAGGDKAMFKAQEGAEDSFENGERVIQDYSINQHDVVCGIAASGRTPFVRGALHAAKKSSIPTILITTNSKDTIRELGID
ncbi:MAG: N-acetylmuramic acid 6-phosphate etherase, partial [Candidatus Kapabacteria bacterium]|nr:N-acetylmuramic acid 6-phosphate etherase [Candidatus Kapabacteria bacterium]